MKKTNLITVALIVVSSMALLVFASEKFNPHRLGESKFIIDDFEGNVSADHGCGNGAEENVKFISVKEDAAGVHSGDRAMKVEYDKTFGGYIFCARGYGLTPAIEIPEEQLIWPVKPEDIDFTKFNTFGFFLKGDKTGNSIAIDLFDANKEIFRTIIKDESNEWTEITIPLDKFEWRTDYQPDWNICNKAMDFPIKVYQIEPLTGTGKEIRGVLYIDDVFFSGTSGK